VSLLEYLAAPMHIGKQLSVAYGNAELGYGAVLTDGVAQDRAERFQSLAAHC
jgi:hypothetical protein